MKYAILGHRNSIAIVQSTLPVLNTRFVEITDEQAQEISSLHSDKKHPVWVGYITSIEEEYDAGNKLQWDDLTKTLSVVAITQSPIILKAWQAKAVLAATPHPEGGTMLSQAEAMIAAMPDGLEKITIASAFANNADFSENSATVVSLAQTLGINTEQIHGMFAMGKSLTI